MSNIHKTAIIEDGAILGENVTVGALLLRISIKIQYRLFFIRLITACMIRFQKTLLIFMLSGEGRQSLKLEKIMLFLIM
jgi:hypothetical protein